MSDLSRRGLLTGAVALAAGSALSVGERKSRRDTTRRTLRVAYLTDVHLDTDDRCINGFTRALEKIHDLDDRPQLIIQGGDLIMDGLVRDEGSVQRQYDLARRILDKHCTIPVQHVIGNHDVWGWGILNRSGITADPRYGKGWWLDWTNYPSSYRSFDAGRWHFILLDSIAPERRPGYAAKLDLEQMKWLERDLAKTDADTPVCIVSHVPILSAAATFFGPCERSGHWLVPRSLMHIDARAIKDLLLKHPNVKTCLSGHIHMADRVDYNGVKHFGIGAVCGAWWKGPMQETPPQFAIVDFFDNGHVHTTLVPC